MKTARPFLTIDYGHGIVRNWSRQQFKLFCRFIDVPPTPSSVPIVRERSRAWAESLTFTHSELREVA